MPDCSMCMWSMFSKQVTETVTKSSVAMEPLGMRRGLASLVNQGVPVSILTTDRSTSIRKIMRIEYPTIKHQVDPWHCSKGNKIFTQRHTHSASMFTAFITPATQLCGFSRIFTQTHTQRVLFSVFIITPPSLLYSHNSDVR